MLFTTSLIIGPRKCRTEAFVGFKNPVRINQRKIWALAQGARARDTKTPSPPLSRKRNCNRTATGLNSAPLSSLGQCTPLPSFTLGASCRDVGHSLSPTSAGASIAIPALRKNCSARCIRQSRPLPASHSTFAFAPHRRTTLSAPEHAIWGEVSSVSCDTSPGRRTNFPITSEAVLDEVLIALALTLSFCVFLPANSRACWRLPRG
jgi:hypothetical protein